MYCRKFPRKYHTRLNLQCYYSLHNQLDGLMNMCDYRHFLKAPHVNYTLMQAAMSLTKYCQHVAWDTKQVCKECVSD